MLAPNTLLQNRYSVIRPIGEGGMGTVYLAKDLRLGSNIALKETAFFDIQMRKAFEREARLLANLRHPALPKVIDHFEEGAGQFLVMEFITGDDLEDMLVKQGKPFPVDQALRWTDGLLDALDYLHTQATPILHRDIKPANLKLASRDQIILLDFGLAKGKLGEMTSVATSKSVLGFTPNFASLEQINGTGTDARSDLYSLAATVYYLITAIVPPNAVTRATASVADQPDPLVQANLVNSQVNSAVSSVLMRAMALNPSQRPATAAEMRKVLQDAINRRATLETDKAIQRELLGRIPPTIQSAGLARRSLLVSTIPARDFSIDLAARETPQTPSYERPRRFNLYLVLFLSLFGAVMGLASLSGQTGRAEPLIWLVIFVFYAWMIANYAPGKYFLHGFLTSVVNSIWITAIHATFFEEYAKNNPQFVQSAPPGMNPRVLMIIMGPLFGVLFGLVAGLFAFIASKIVKKHG